MKRKKPTKPKKPPRQIPRAPGPVTNRRKANTPLAPARASRFLQRVPVAVVPLLPRDEFDQTNPADVEAPTPEDLPE